MNRDHLRNSLEAGCYTTERDSIFWKRCDDGTRTLSGAKLMVPQGSHCRPVRSTGNSLLVRYSQPNGDHWFAWIHA